MFFLSAMFIYKMCSRISECACLLGRDAGIHDCSLVASDKGHADITFQGLPQRNSLMVI